MADKTKVIDLCLLYNEMAFVRQDFRIIDRWLADGCDMEQDVLPWMREAMGKFKDITALRWFEKGVYRKRDERLAREEVQARLAAKNAPPSPDTVFRQMRHIAFMTRKLGRCMPDDTRRLEAYEKEHGGVEI